MNQRKAEYYDRTGGNFTINVEMTREEAHAVLAMNDAGTDDDRRLQNTIRRRISYLCEKKKSAAKQD